MSESSAPIIITFPQSLGDLEVLVQQGKAAKGSGTSYPPRPRRSRIRTVAAWVGVMEGATERTEQRWRSTRPTLARAGGGTSRGRRPSVSKNGGRFTLTRAVHLDQIWSRRGSREPRQYGGSTPARHDAVESSAPSCRRAWARRPPWRTCSARCTPWPGRATAWDRGRPAAAPRRLPADNASIESAGAA